MNIHYLYELGNELKDINFFLKVCASEPSKCHIMPRRYLKDTQTLIKIIEAMKSQLIKCADQAEKYDEVEFLLKSLGL